MFNCTKRKFNVRNRNQMCSKIVVSITDLFRILLVVTNVQAHQVYFLFGGENGVFCRVLIGRCMQSQIWGLQWLLLAMQSTNFLDLIFRSMGLACYTKLAGIVVFGGHTIFGNNVQFQDHLDHASGFSFLDQILLREDVGCQLICDRSASCQI